jgi:hypothetical protein
MKQYILILLTIFSFSSCAARKHEVISKSIIKLEEKNTNIRDLINIEGYYTHTKDSSFIISNNIMFFEDGSYACSFTFKEGTTYEKVKKNMSSCVTSWIRNNQIRWGTYWGVYRLEGDTIIGYCYIRSGLWGGEWSLDEIRYKIKDRTTIIPIYSRGLLKVDEKYYKEFNISPWIKNNSPYQFVPCDSLPPSDCWLKEEKWIWRHESDWKDYMNMIEQKKIKKK